MPMSSCHDLEATLVKTTLCIPRCTPWSIHDHLDPTADLSSHPYIWWPTSVLTGVKPHHIGWTLRQSSLQLVLTHRSLAQTQDLVGLPH